MKAFGYIRWKASEYSLGLETLYMMWLGLNRGSCLGGDATLNTSVLSAFVLGFVQSIKNKAKHANIKCPSTNSDFLYYANTGSKGSSPPESLPLCK